MGPFVSGTLFHEAVVSRTKKVLVWFLLSALAALAIAAPSGNNIAGAGDEDERLLANELKGHRDCVNGLAYSPDGKLLASASSDGTVKLWDTSSYKEVRTLKGHVSAVTCVVFTSDSKQLITGGLDKSVRLWDAAEGRQMLAIQDGLEPIWKVAMCPTGRYFAFAGGPAARTSPAEPGAGRTQVRAWDLDSGKQLFERWFKDSPPIRSLAYYPNGKRLAVSRKRVELWDAETSEFIRAYQPDGDEPPADLALILSNYPCLVACGKLPSGDSGIQAWNAETGKHGYMMVGDPIDDNRIALTHGSHGWDHYVASAGAQAVRVWETVSAKQLHVFPRPNVRALAFSSDGKHLAAGLVNGTVRIWRVGDSK